MDGSSFRISKIAVGIVVTTIGAAGWCVIEAVLWLIKQL